MKKFIKSLLNYLLISQVLIFSFCLFVSENLAANEKLNLKLTVDIRGRHTGNPQAGVEVMIEDAWGYFNYVHKRSKFSESNGKAIFGPDDLQGFTMQRGQQWHSNPYNPRLGGKNYLKIKIIVEDKTKYIELKEEKAYTVTIEI